MPTCLLAYTADPAGHDALQLARNWVGSHSDWQILVCHVAPDAWGNPSLQKLDQAYAEFLAEKVRQTLDDARGRLSDLADTAYIKFSSASVASGLLQAAQIHRADLIVLGSSRAGNGGQIVAGSVAGEIMHTSPVPVLIAPGGYAQNPPTVIERISCAYSGLDDAGSTVLAALGMATILKVALRLTSFGVYEQRMYPSVVSHRAEQVLAESWREQVGSALQKVEQQLAGLNHTIQTAVGVAESWQLAMQAMDWLPGELLVLGSSRRGVLERVFMGSNASKILRAAPVPVLLLPRTS